MLIAILQNHAIPLEDVFTLHVQLLQIVQQQRNLLAVMVFAQKVYNQTAEVVLIAHFARIILLDVPKFVLPRRPRRLLLFAMHLVKHCLLLVHSLLDNVSLALVNAHFNSDVTLSVTRLVTVEFVTALIKFPVQV